MSKFHHIALFSRRKNIQEIAETLRGVYQFLQKKKLSVAWENHTAEALKITDQPIYSQKEIGEKCDLIIVVGGDGSLLNAANAFVDHDIPVVTINRGQLGFLTDILPNEMEEKLSAILAGDYQLEERFLLSGEIYTRKGELVAKNKSLNEVALYAAHAARLMEFEVYINGKFVFTQRSDGLIIATPTGSTAYALSGGGAILHPQLPCITLVPMMPHDLTSRPIVISSDSAVDVIVTRDMHSDPDVSWDGQQVHTFHLQNRLHIQQHPHRLRILHPQDYDYYQTLRTKLQWGNKLTNNLC